MHRVELTYALHATDRAPRELHHPLIEMLDAIQTQGSISAAARHVGRSYRHVWGELKRWEGELGHELLVWSKGQRAALTPFGAKLLWAERQAQARLAPQLAALRGELEHAFAIAFDDTAAVVEMAASHDEALPLLRGWAARRCKLHLDISFTGSVDALAALNDGRCLVAGFHALVDAPRGSQSARAYRPLLKPMRHRLIGFASRSQGLIVAATNPLRIKTVSDLARPGLRFVNRARVWVAASKSSRTTRVPVPRARFTKRTPGRARSRTPASASGLPGATIRPWRRDAKPISLCRPGFSSGR